jgi:hypothetical protein
MNYLYDPTLDYYMDGEYICTDSRQYKILLLKKESAFLFFLKKINLKSVIHLNFSCSWLTYLFK